MFFMFNNDLQENNKIFEQAVDLLANIFVNIIDNKAEEGVHPSLHSGSLVNNKSNPYEKEKSK